LESIVNDDEGTVGNSVKTTQYLGVALLFMWGCQVLPTATRTGDVKNIILKDDVGAQEIVVNTGDEIRWINDQTRFVQIVFTDPRLDQELSCKNNIGGILTPSNTARMAPNETASICFRYPGLFRYIVRMETGLTFG
jgi:plastocyanin